MLAKLLLGCATAPYMRSTHHCSLFTGRNGNTLLHQSFNETDQTRYYLFVDMVRPPPFPGVMRAVISGVRFFTQSFKFIYYQNWKVIER